MSLDLKNQNIYDLIQCSYATNIVFILTKRNVFDQLLRAPSSASTLAQALDVQADVLRDLLLFAHAIGLLKMEGDIFRLSKQCLPLTQKSGSWLRSYLMVWGEQLNPAFGKLDATLATGNNAFELAHHRRIWDYYSNNPQQNALFVDFMSGVTDQAHLPVIVDEWDLPAASSLLDVGGGTGTLACALAQKYAALTTTVYDQPSNAMKAAQKIAANGLSGRCNFIGGNLFQSVPPDHDVYSIKHVLHDWDDDNASTILTCISKAMRQDARLVIIEGILDRPFEPAAPDRAYLQARNIEQRVWTSGRVRTLAQFEMLCEQAALEIQQVKHASIFDISYITCIKSSSHRQR